MSFLIGLTSPQTKIGCFLPLNLFYTVNRFFAKWFLPILSLLFTTVLIFHQIFLPPNLFHIRYIYLGQEPRSNLMMSSLALMPLNRFVSKRNLDFVPTRRGG